MGNQWNGSKVMEEFAKIAAESGFIVSDLKAHVGNTDKDTPVKDHRRYEPGKEYNVTKETGKDLIEKAHPKDAIPAEAMGDGGLVENSVQQQEKDIEIAIRMPAGALFGKHADLINNLVSLANDLEGEGKAELAARIDKTIEKISNLPFEQGLQKEAGFMATLLLAPLKALLWGGSALGAWKLFGTKLTSIRENLPTDIQDVIDVSKSVGEDPSLSRLSADLNAILQPYVEKFKQPLPSVGQEAELKQYLANIDSFEKELPKVVSIVTTMTAISGPWYKFGLDAKSKLKEKLSDMLKTFEETISAIKGFAAAGKPAAAKIENNISKIQEFLSKRGIKTSQNGQLDPITKDALRQLENEIDRKLRQNPMTAEILKQRDWSILGSILRQDGTVMDFSLLERLVGFADLL